MPDQVDQCVGMNAFVLVGCERDHVHEGVCVNVHAFA